MLWVDGPGWYYALMKEVLLVGAQHSFTVQHSLFGDMHYEVDPPDELLTVVGNQARVAIEMLPGDMDIPTDVKGMSVRQLERNWYIVGDHLFRAAGRKLQSAGHEIREIDDPKLGAEKLLLAKDIAYLRNKKYRNEGWLTPKNERKLGRSLARISFINSVLREEQMLSAASRSDPDVVIIGEAHADRLAADGQLQKNLGLRVKEYVRLIPSNVGYFMSGYVGKQIHATSEFVYPTRDEVVESARKHSIGRTLDQRRDNAFRYGRVLHPNSPRPDFLGRFYISGLAAQSMFELHIENSKGTNFTGRVYDLLGDALVTGTFGEHGPNFVKQYVPKLSHERAPAAPIHYLTTRDNDGLLSGCYNTTPDTCYGPTFVMTRFTNRPARRLEYKN